MSRDYYCNFKFKFLRVDLESWTTYNCHAASPHKVNFDWLKNNPGQLFNSPVSINERGMMLLNQRAPSCEQNCWPAEDKNQLSPRLWQKGNIRSHDQVTTQPEILDLVISSDCNLTCSYCCKENSSSWRRDIVDNGDYHLPNDNSDRYRINNKDKIFYRLSQNEKKQNSRYRALLDELVAMGPGLSELRVTGGEPFLDNNLLSMIRLMNLRNNCELTIYTGLGVEFKRFEKLINALVEFPELRLIVSAENIEHWAQFNRYGIKWSEFEKKLSLLDRLKVNYSFHSVISNLTVHGFGDFFKRLGDKKIKLTFAYQPSMMASHVLDSQTKQHVLETLDNLPTEFVQSITNNLLPVPSEADRSNISTWLKLYVSRRKDLTFDLLPKTFRSWLEI